VWKYERNSTCKLGSVRQRDTEREFGEMPGQSGSRRRQENAGKRICVCEDKPPDFFFDVLPSFAAEHVKLASKLSGFGGLRGSVLAFRTPKFAGSNPSRSRRIFQGEKKKESPARLPFGREVKLWVPCRIRTGM
jgi:hypothetical protein